ncbi:hypothetical protein [Microbulbifer pacificus]|uniref:hypothetical protein n=1 Tax=Microbulbifer pacificus TaxID=407164 RepID=UPI000CF474EA|nr:hypothetical protein [Microbulbifer pacificus]
MSVGAWEPTQPASNDQLRKDIDRELLSRIIDALQESDEGKTPGTAAPELETLDSSLTSASWLSLLPSAQWLDEAKHWSGEQLWALIRFFTLAETQLQGWQGGAGSPVIPLAKSLRLRKSPLTREQLLWIRQHSDNRYLPYGPL